MNNHCPTCGRLDASLVPLTSVQFRILYFIVSYIDDFGYPPLYREIAHQYDYRSPATVHEHIKNIERKGWIETSPTKCRSIRVVAA